MSLAIVAIDKVGGRCWLVYLKHDSGTRAYSTRDEGKLGEW
jgi:hypothetical protein